MKQTDPQFKLRLPPALKQELEAQAAVNDRTLGVEIVSRLQDSLHKVTIDEGKLQSLQSELEQQRHQTASYRQIGGYIDGVRALVAGQLLDLMPLVPVEKWPPGVDTSAALNLARWLAQKDDRSAALSLLKMIEKADAEIIQALREVASTVDRPGVDRLSDRLSKVRKAAKKT